MSPEQRIEAALKIALDYSQYKGDWHRAYGFEQIVRCLTGCPYLTKEAIDVNGLPYSYKVLGESEEYKEALRRYRAAEGGPDTHDWSTGSPPP